MSLYYCVSSPWGETQLTKSPHSPSLSSLSIGSGGGVSFCKGRVIFSGFLIASLRGCPGLLSRGDWDPAQYHCLSHFPNYKLSMVRGLGWVPVILKLDWGVWVVGRLLPHTMLGLPHLVPH